MFSRSIRHCRVHPQFFEAPDILLTGVVSAPLGPGLGARLGTACQTKDPTNKFYTFVIIFDNENTLVLGPNKGSESTDQDEGIYEETDEAGGISWHIRMEYFKRQNRI